MCTDKRDRHHWESRMKHHSNYRHIGNCECFSGVYENHREECGRFSHFSEPCCCEKENEPAKEELISELETLKRRKAHLEKIMEELERKIKEFYE